MGASAWVSDSPRDWRYAMPESSLTLRTAIKILEAHYGPPPPPPSRDPFELVLWENAAYLASPARRREAIEALKREVGATPHDILAAPARTLERIASRGILASMSAAKL